MSVRFGSSRRACLQPSSIILLTCLAVAVMSWIAAYNTLFDVVESRIARRVASDRPHLWRVAHAVGLEVTSIVVTWPLIGLAANLAWPEAFAADLGLDSCLFDLWVFLSPRLRSPASSRMQPRTPDRQWAWSRARTASGKHPGSRRWWTAAAVFTLHLPVHPTGLRRAGVRR